MTLANTGAEDAETVARRLDITAERCPMTFVRVRLALDAMRPGEVLAVRLAGEEPRARVPETLREQGHALLATDEAGDGVVTLTVRKGP